MDERDEVHLPPPPAARCSTEVNRRSNVSASEEDEGGVKLQPRCYIQPGERVTGREAERELKEQERGGGGGGGAVISSPA